MKKFVLCVSVLFFGIVKPKAQEIAATHSPNNNCYWKTASLFDKKQPLEIIRFHGKMNNTRITLEWTIKGNENANLFEIEKSSNGKDFATTGLVFCSEKEGTEQYAFFEKAPKKAKFYYRLKLIDKSHTVDYSSVLTVDSIERI